MQVAIIPLLAYVALLSTFFAFLGIRRGVWWVASPLIAGVGIGAALLVLGLATSPLFTPVAIATVLCPVVVSLLNRELGYRWWPSLAMSRGVLVGWLVVNALLLGATVSALVGLILLR